MFCRSIPHIGITLVLLLLCLLRSRVAQAILGLWLLGGLAILLRIACDRYAGKDREKKTDFFSVEAWRSTAEFIANNFRKGKLIEITGSLQTNPWTDKNDSKHEGVRILAERVSFAPTEAVPTEGAAERPSYPSQPPAIAQAPAAAPTGTPAADLSAAFAGFDGLVSSFSSTFEEAGETGDLPF